MVRVRFAPSPTGFLHIGNVRTALFNYLFAKKNKGRFILRIEDTDKERSRPEFIEQIYEDLHWLGVNWDEGPDIGGEYGPYLQSKRAGLHQEYVKKLVSEGNAYECYCTEEELEALRKEQLASGQTPRYDNRCRNLTDLEKKAYKDEGRTVSIRFRMPDEKIFVSDIIRGDVEFDVTLFGDFVIVRPDGSPTFHLAVCVDDGLMKITHVVRGEDHFSNTPRHVAIFKACGFDVPKFAHMPLTMGPGGEPLSKRFGAMSIAEYRRAGYLPQALCNYMSLLGWSSGTDQELFSMGELKSMFTLERVVKSAAIFDKVKMDWVSGEHIRAMEDEEYTKACIQHMLKEKIVENDEYRIKPEWYSRVLLLFKNYIRSFGEIKEKLELFNEEIDYPDIQLIKNEDSFMVLKYLHVLLRPVENIDEEAFDRIFKELKKKTKQKGKALFMPARIAVSGEEHGPDLKQVFILLGKDNCMERIDKAVSLIEEGVSS